MKTAFIMASVNELVAAITAIDCMYTYPCFDILHEKYCKTSLEFVDKLKQRLTGLKNGKSLCVVANGYSFKMTRVNGGLWEVYGTATPVYSLISEIFFIRCACNKCSVFEKEPVYEDPRKLCSYSDYQYDVGIPVLTEVVDSPFDWLDTLFGIFQQKK